jgi:hypothetical protein
MPKGVVGTMDTVGWIQEPAVKIDRAIAYWFANRIDQCIILRDIHSYQYVVAKHQDDKNSEAPFLAEIKQNLNEYMLQIFDTASIDAYAQRDNPEDKMFTLVLSGVVGQDGKEYDLARSVYVEGGSYKLIDTARELNNGK